MPRRQMNVAIDEADKKAFIELCAAQNLIAKAHDPSLRIAFGGTAGVPFDFIEESKKAGLE